GLRSRPSAVHARRIAAHRLHYEPARRRRTKPRRRARPWRKEPAPMTRRPTPPTSPTRDRQRVRTPQPEWPSRPMDPVANWFDEDRPGDEGGFGHVSELGISRPDTHRERGRRP